MYRRGRYIYRLYVTATVLAVYCLAVGSTLPPWWQMSANAVGRDESYVCFSPFVLLQV